MSVLVQNTEGWFVDACSLIDRGYSRCLRFQDKQNSRVTCRFKRQCFHILKSHCSVNACAAVDGGNADMLQKTEQPLKVNPAGILHRSLRKNWAFATEMIR